MFIITLKFSNNTNNKSQAVQFMQEHNAWVKNGFDQGVFLFAGTIQPSLGGVIIAVGITKQALDDMINTDPFVREDIVRPEIMEIKPSQMAEELKPFFTE